MRTIDDLIQIMDELLGENGCPWDKEQTLDSLKQYIRSETEEVCEAVDHGDMENLCEELGDVLFEVVFFAALAKRQGSFSMDEVIEGICEKMIRRHPHVFGGVKVDSAQEALALWKEIKRQEKAQKT